jgi:hypothetical protein
MKGSAAVSHPKRFGFDRVRPIQRIAAIAVFALATIVSAPRSVLADEGGVSFWIPGFFGSLAATPQHPGWLVATILLSFRQDGGLRSLENPSDIDASLEKCLGKIGAIAHQSTSLTDAQTADRHGGAPCDSRRRSAARSSKASPPGAAVAAAAGATAHMGRFQRIAAITAP